MLAYHPAFDIYHCSFRLLLLMEFAEYSETEIDRLRIWDFYYTFPRETVRISFPQDLSSLRPKQKYLRNPYEDVEDPLMVFERMRPFQTSAIKFLFGHGFFESSDINQEKIVRTSKPVPSNLTRSFDSLFDGQRYVLELFSSAFNRLSLYGPSGLKARTKLIDYRYDPV